MDSENYPTFYNCLTVLFLGQLKISLSDQLAQLQWMLAGNITGDSSDNFHLNDFASRKYLEFYLNSV